MAKVNYYQDEAKINPTKQTGNSGGGGEFGNTPTNGYISVADLNAETNGLGAKPTAEKLRATDAARIAATGNKPVKAVKGNPVMPPTTGDETTPVTYIDANGQKQTGVMETPQNVEDFSYWDSMREYYEKMYADQVKANNTAAANQTAFILGEVNKQIEAVGQKYKSTNMQLYQDYMANRKSLPQILAANGYTGGLSESSRINMETGYQNQLAQNQRARINEENVLNSNFLRSQYEAQSAADAANAQALQQKYGYLAQLQQQQYAEEQNDLKARAETLASTGDFSGFLALGYNQPQVDYMTRVFLQQNPKLLGVWVKSHPEEAARLGLTMPSTGGGAGKQDQNAEIEARYWQYRQSGDFAGAAEYIKEMDQNGLYTGKGTIMDDSGIASGNTGANAQILFDSAREAEKTSNKLSDSEQQKYEQLLRRK